MIAVAITLKMANDCVECWHRHHKPVVGHKFSIGAIRHRGGHLVGAVICGRPVNRHLDNRHNIEVLRLATYGEKNVCSFLYSAAARSAREIGYEKIDTYILDSETGTSLIAAGWIFESMTAGGEWIRSEGLERSIENTERKQRFSKTLRLPVSLHMYGQKKGV